MRFPPLAGGGDIDTGPNLLCCRFPRQSPVLMGQTPSRRSIPRRERGLFPGDGRCLPFERPITTSELLCESALPALLPHAEEEPALIYHTSFSVDLAFVSCTFASHASRLLPLKDPDLPHPIERFAISKPFIFKQLCNFQGIFMLYISDVTDLIDQLLAPAICILVSLSPVRAIPFIKLNN